MGMPLMSSVLMTSGWTIAIFQTALMALLMLFKDLPMSPFPTTTLKITTRYDLKFQKTFPLPKS